MGKPQKHNVNDIVKHEVKNNNVNVNDNDNVSNGGSSLKGMKWIKANKCKKANKVDSIADNLVAKFKAPNSRNFFCKCAWKLSEDEIWSTFEQAHKPKINSPLKYFIAVCSIKMSR